MRIALIILLVVAGSLQAQELAAYNSERLKTDQRLMLTLGTWSAVNFIGSGIGWALSEPGEARYFHQMNVYWNTVNAALALPGYFKSKKLSSDLPASETIREQYKTEKLFLFNTGLDLTYITIGFMLRNQANYQPEKRDILNGYVSSLILQGGFLFVFDLTAQLLHSQHRKKKLEPLLDRLTVSPSGLGLGLQFDLRPTDRRSFSSVDQGD